MAKNLEEFKQVIADAERTAIATSANGFAEPLPFDVATESQLRAIAFGFDKIFGVGNGS